MAEPITVNTAPCQGDPIPQCLEQTESPSTSAHGRTKAASVDESQGSGKSGAPSRRGGTSQPFPTTPTESCRRPRRQGRRKGTRSGRPQRPPGAGRRPGSGRSTSPPGPPRHTLVAHDQVDQREGVRLPAATKWTPDGIGRRSARAHPVMAASHPPPTPGDTGARLHEPSSIPATALPVRRPLGRTVLVQGVGRMRGRIPCPGPGFQPSGLARGGLSLPSPWADVGHE